MTQRRALSDMLIDVADGVLGMRVPDGLRATAMEVAVPVEVEMAKTEAGPEFRAELLRFITRTSFDVSPSRMTVRWAEGVAP
jgi:hypothetical protein